jgi:hypothetical protein
MMYAAAADADRNSRPRLNPRGKAGRGELLPDLCWNIGQAAVGKFLADD